MTLLTFGAWAGCRVLMRTGCELALAVPVPADVEVHTRSWPTPCQLTVSCRKVRATPTGPYPASMGRVLLARPRGYCAGVDRAVQTVERALETFGAPVYVRRQIVHNLHVVRRLEELGAVFVEHEDEIPPGEICVLSAHGVAPAVKLSLIHI